MAEKGIPSIYDIDFAVLDEEKYRGVVRSVPKPVGEISTGLPLVVVEPIGRVALAANADEGVPSTSEEAEVVIDIPKPIAVEQPNIETTPVDSLLEVPQEAIEPQIVSSPPTPEKTQMLEPAKVADYEAFAAKYFGEFPDINLLITAFTHRSYLIENRRSDLVLEHNERLEFLGDSILNAAVAEHLYRNYTDAEGMLTQWRTALTRNSTISAVAEREGFEPLLRLSKSFKGSSISYIGSRKQILANCYEAVLGAVYLTQGNEAVKGFVETTLLPTLDVVMKDGTWKDPKGRLQELLQGSGNSLPEYRVIHREGPDHNKVVVVGVYVNDKLIAEGAGSGSKEAETTAAVNALDALLASYKEEPRDPKTVGVKLS